MNTLDVPAQIVLIEDDKTVNHLLHGFLRRRTKVTSFLDPQTALLSLDPTDERTIFIIDYHLPGISGLALKKQLEPHFSCAKYLLTCGISTVRLADVHEIAGFDAVLAKPYHLPSLLQKICEIDQQWPE
jgi:FixJ family two-component response regulator